MKSSKYNIFHKQDGQIYLYHQLSEALIEIDEELHDALIASNIDNIPTDIQKYLKDVCVIVDDEMQECNVIQFANQRNRYNADFLRITILPTLACNFKCWYCYETHKSSKMTTEAMQAVLTFVKQEVVSKNKKGVVLDWFGGEPMLCFENVVYPFSKQLLSWCKEVGVALYNITTTNGSLITEESVEKMKEIGLSQFQITLDGDKDFHNKTRFSAALKDSYSKIIDNIILLCRELPNSHIELRINYTPENVHSLSRILNEFPWEVRNKIRISPHVVWQKSDQIMNLTPCIEEFLHEAEAMGYSVSNHSTTKRCVSCYTENADQYVINYDLSVYKCTARDYDQKYSIGKISSSGKFQPNGLYYKYMTTQSPFVNKKCLQCDILPSCLFASGCLQKKIEKSSFSCCRALIERDIKRTIINKIQVL